MSKSCTAKNDLSNNKNPTTRDSGVFGSSRGFSEVSKFWFSRFNCSGSYLLKLVGFIGAKLGCKFRQKSHFKTPLESYMNHIYWTIYFREFFPVFLFLGGEVGSCCFFLCLLFFGRHLIFEKFPKRPVLSLLGCFFSDVLNHQLRRRF